MVATTASIDLIANKGAQCAHMSIFTNYQVKRCGGPMLLQNWGGGQWNRRNVGALIGGAGWAVRTARRGRSLERGLADFVGDLGQSSWVMKALFA